jgi:hypothetical protein
MDGRLAFEDKYLEAARSGVIYSIIAREVSLDPTNSGHTLKL